MDDLKRIIGANIKRHRTRKGITLQQIGDAIGVSKNAARQYEQGLALPSKENQGKIAELLKISLDDLTSGVVESSQAPEADAAETTRKVIQQELYTEVRKVYDPELLGLREFISRALSNELPRTATHPPGGEIAQPASREKHLNNLLDQAIAREQELERELELERRRRIPDLDRYRRNKETIQALKENHPELHLSEEDEEDFCISNLGFYGGALSKNVIGEIERLRERRRLVDNVKNLFGQQPEVAKKLLELLEQAGGVERLKKFFE